MVNKYQLYADWISANARAADLERLADRLKCLAESTVTKEMSYLKENWTGSASKEYLAKGNRLKNKMLEESRSLRTVALTIRRIAQRTYESEIRALELANSRTYN